MLVRVSGFRRPLGYRPELGRNQQRIEVTGLITDTMNPRVHTLFLRAQKSGPQAALMLSIALKRSDQRKSKMPKMASISASEQ